MNLWLRSLEGRVCRRTGSCLCCRVGYGRRVLRISPCAVHTCSERTTSRSPRSRYRQTNNPSWWQNSAQSSSSSPNLKKGCSNNHITWFLQLPPPTVYLSTVLIVWSHFMEWVISILQHWPIWPGKMTRYLLSHRRMGLFRSLFLIRQSLVRCIIPKRALWKILSLGCRMCLCSGQSQFSHLYRLSSRPLMSQFQVHSQGLSKRKLYPKLYPSLIND